MKLKNNKILITGGASGIGLGLSKRFLKEGNTVIVCGRRQDVLDEFSGKYPGTITRKCDLEQSDDRTALYKWISEEHSDLNVLVNNAGVQNWMSINDEGFMDRARKELAINIEAPVHLCSLFTNLPSLDTIMNVTSGLAFVPFTKVPVYSATKAFFRSFTLSLRYMLQGRNIEVIEIIPPALKTDLGGPGLHDHAPDVNIYIDAIFEQLEQGKNELSFGFSQSLLNASPDELKEAFARLNP